MVADSVVATLSLVAVTASFPFYAYGAWIILSVEVVSWPVLVRHLKYIAVGLLLTTGPVVGWMAPRLFSQLETGLAVIHAFLGLQAYALLAFALTGIVRIFQVKRRHSLYEDPDPDVDLDDLHEHMSAWRGRLRVGVFGYLGFWVLAYLVGVWRYLGKYWGI